MLDPVPWLVGGGAVHSPSVVRTSSYIGTGGASGVVDPEDLAVTQLPVPGSAVRVAAGAFAIENTYPGQSSQSYEGRNDGYEDVAIPATGGSPRSDMLILRIDDPEFGGTTPSDPTVGPYVRFALLSNVGAGATQIPGSVNYPAIPIARIDVPASTATITSAMIRDLRSLIAPKSRREIGTGGEASTLTATAADPGQAWPKAAGWDIFVPAWATHVIATGIITGIKVVGDGNGRIWIRMGSTGDADAKITNQPFYDSAAVAGSAQRLAVSPAAKIAIPDSMRGTTVNFTFRGYVALGTGTSRPLYDSGTSVLMDLSFVQEPI